ncbi:hypothetical protein G7068_11615 [Leucobacter viscericola]|uniref:Surface antigen n=1 Tax=Leucobacter viscericola TaxID=2714935 RepID=A0A6G7XHC2_9MICO|nr:hypothetical protein [Leucobacter viscericola]QIK63761.1 hypothetical protein G7068_11615 [Leucobacter viscericola]
MRKMNGLKLAVTAAAVSALLFGGATVANAADYQSGTTGYLGVSNPSRAAFAQYFGTNTYAPAGVALIKASDTKSDGNSALTVLQKKQSGKWVEVSRVIASKGINSTMQRGVSRPKKGTQLRVTSCVINMSAPAAKRVGFNCQSNTFYAP